ncbi:MAG: 3-ketoacyl-ACP reductase [Spirosomaceae bacterium]|nr:3-ketoacyl-ACP reductase [Spirosomataceae bacterium]
MKPIAFITGGSRGIGLGIAEHLADQGFDLAINGMREEAAVQEVLTQLRTRGAEVIYCQGDVASREAREAMLSNIKSHFGRLNLLVNNAGVAPKIRADVLETTEESFDYVLNTNLKSNYFLTQAVAHWMIQQKQENPDFEARIINVSSISATVASVNRGEYCVSKAGLSMVTQLFAARLGEFGIPVYEVRPGVIKTIATGAFPYSTGQVFMIDGGLTLSRL